MKLPEDLPKKLKHDAIVEVNFEARFDTDLLVAEILFGRLADTPAWKGFLQRRLPTADIPAALRRADPDLRYQSSIQLIDSAGIRRVGIGPQNLSFSRVAPYPGWDEKFGEEVGEVIDILFKAVPNISVTRLGLRYVNALRSDLHGIAGIESMNLKLSLGTEAITRKLNVNYTVPTSTDSSCTVRIASADLAHGSIPENTTLVVDLDVYTNEGYQTSDSSATKAWAATAHLAEKRIFFGLLTDETIKHLRSD